MARVSEAYSAVEDLLIGDITLPERHGDGTGMIKRAAGEIDGQIGHIYKTPINVDALSSDKRPTVLLLSQINNLIASGRLILDMAAADEDDGNHSYGSSLLREGIRLLDSISSGRVELAGAEKLETSEKRGPVIHNEDPESLVQSYYRGARSPLTGYLGGAGPYGGNLRP